jgi:hypothetical protein
VPPRSNTAIKRKKSVISFAGKSAQRTPAAYKPPPRRAKPPPANTDLFTTQEAAGFLNCSPQTLDKMRRAGGGPTYVMIGEDLIRYPRAELDNYIVSRVRANTAQVK